MHATDRLVKRSWPISAGLRSVHPLYRMLKTSGKSPSRIGLADSPRVDSSALRIFRPASSSAVTSDCFLSSSHVRRVSFSLRAFAAKEASALTAPRDNAQ